VILLKKLRDKEAFIPHEEIFELLEKTRNPGRKRIEEIVSKSLEKERLSCEETAFLLNAEDPQLVEMIFQAARELKNKIYGNRVVLFAPLYTS